ncbi:MAG: 4Fe-4S binding protein, partial [Candidatus Nanoarchaeia archaeon]|nr:4Fe-4S binding protein [Candidatus Nanoarchaeia archaeon]
VIGLEGNGPGASGTPVKSKLIMASKSAPAIDIIASEIMGFNPKTIYTNRLSKINREQIQVIGEYKKLNFKKPSSSSIKNLMFLGRLFPRPKITFDKKKCKKCHTCEKKCPVQAISLKTKDKFPECDHKKCIHCLCCVEVCPYDAIFLKESYTQALLTRVAKKIIKV